MSIYDSTEEIIDDLLRSSWIIENARRRVYEGWTDLDAKWEESAHRAGRRVALVEKSLSDRGIDPDHELVEPHADWMKSLLGSGPDETGLEDIFVVRLGEWVEGHVSGFLVDGADTFKELGDQDRASFNLPDALPDSPPFEPVVAPKLETPGDVSFRFAILGDMHVGSDKAAETVSTAIADINDSGAELVVQLGDITDQGNRNQFEEASELLKKLDMPLVTMLGNHDVFSREEQRLAGREYYSPSFGREPDGVILEHKGFRFAVLDSVEHGASPFSPFNMVTGTFAEGPGGAVVRGSLTPPQHEILARVAEPDSPPAFVFLHHPPQPFTGFPPVLFGLRDEDSGRLHATVDSGNVWGVFAGHTHRNARTRTYGSVPAHEVAIPRDFPFGYALVDVTQTGYRYTFHQISDEGLLRELYPSASAIHRRYARGSDEALGFVWTR